MDEDLQDRVRGTLLGLAAGDRNGGPIRMALRLAESLAEQQEYEREDVLSRYLTWWREGGFDAGFVASHVFDAIESGIPASEAVDRAHQDSAARTAGCNPAHRSPPLAMAPFLPDESLPGIASEEASLTHKDPLAGDVAALTVLLCRKLIRGCDWASALEHAAEGRDERSRAALPGVSAGPPGTGGYAPEVLQAALHFVSEGTEFGEALLASIDFAGPANYSPVLVGALGGARWGASSIAAPALDHCDVLGRVRTVADRLAGMWSQAGLDGS